MDELPDLERAALNLTQIFGCVSFISCLCVALEAWGDWRTQKQDTKIVTRIQFYLQIPLATFSLMYALSSVLMKAPYFRGTHATW